VLPHLRLDFVTGIVSGEYDIDHYKTKIEYFIFEIGSRLPRKGELVNNFDSLQPGGR